MELKWMNLDLGHSLQLWLQKDATFLLTCAQFFHQYTDPVTDVYNPHRETECQYLPPTQSPNKDDFHLGLNPKTTQNYSEPSLTVPIPHLKSLASPWHYSKSPPTRTLPTSASIPSVNNFDCVGKIPLIIHVLGRMIHTKELSALGSNFPLVW